MAFRFPIQAILHFRESVEHQEELRLRLVNQQVQRLRHQIEQYDCLRLQHERSASSEIAQGTTAAELVAGLQIKTSLIQQQNALKSELSRLNVVCREQQKRFKEARQKREMLGRLRENLRHEYERKKQRQQQRALDDLFLSRLPKNSNG
jgi:flagellar export protein FliJ